MPEHTATGAFFTEPPGRLFLHVSPSPRACPGDDPLDLVSPDIGGLIVSDDDGVHASAYLEQVADDGAFTGPIIYDPAVYAREIARPDEQPALFALSREMRAASIRLQPARRHAQVSLTPTRYLYPEPYRCLHNAAHAAAEIAAPDIVFAVPVDHTWLDSPHYRELITVLVDTPGPKALILGDDDDPLEKLDRAQHLREIVTSVPGLALLRTGLAGLDALVHGAEFASIGVSAATRRTPPPGLSSTGPRSGPPEVLVPDLMHYVDGQRFSTMLSQTSQVPRCRCPECARGSIEFGERGRPVTTFTEAADEQIAHRHNYWLIEEWHATLMRGTESTKRQDRWRRLCAEALGNHIPINARRHPHSEPLEAPSSLKFWAAG
ncbi:hypothetical protein J4H86_05115 [Spiractinospora alimapuensis]|uniref:hypothetical protein n=1 Tax=Spiractinospora alimapuensis TaxID=2820884 RepID=UPI001F2FCC92|nr:hypothetical protein [Spiractinospora alimapuensis]QVQ53168.1 hypothetical protein J4H86_05115 [Spiractinospora alimapuensis]